MTATTAELRPLLKRLKLGPMLGPSASLSRGATGSTTPTSCRSSSPTR